MADISTEIRQLISSSKLKAAIELLSRHISGKDQDMETQLAVLTSRLERLNRESRMGLLSRSEENTERTKITFGLLGLVADAQNYLGISPLSPDPKSRIQNDFSKEIAQKEKEIGNKQISLLLEKLDFLKEKEAYINDPGQQFQLKKEIEDLEKKIEEIKSKFS